MPILRFDGQGAGLDKRLGGNANSAADYTLLCDCTNPATESRTVLGPLARFLPNQAGQRSAFCPICNTMTVIDKNGQILSHIPWDLATAKQVGH